MRKRQSTITQQYSPTFRRRLNTNYLSLSLPGGIHGFNLHQVQNQQTPIDITSPPSADKRLQKIKQIYQNSQQHYTKIHQIIDQVDQIIKRRMQAHQQGLLSVVKSQIDRMQLQCKRIVQQYNQMLQQKNKQTEIYNLKNQVQYFRNTAMKYYQDNKRLNQQNKQYKILIKNKDSIIQELNQVIKRSTKKYMRQKMICQRKQKQKQEVTSKLWQKIKTLTDQSSAQISNEVRTSIKQQFPPVQSVNAKQIDSTKTKQKSSFSQRYSKSKSNIVTVLQNNSINKRLNTNKTVMSFDVQPTIITKPKNAGKSKSFWKFDSII